MQHLHNFVNNPQNPKFVKVPFITFLAMGELFNHIDPNNLSADEMGMYNQALDEIDSKKNAIRNRQAFAGVVQAQTQEEKEAAFENYKNTRDLFK